MITNDAKRTSEIKSRIAVSNAAFNKKETLHQLTGFIFKGETFRMWSSAL
jgi:hypothetical protein